MTVAHGPLDGDGRPWWELRLGRYQDVLADVEPDHVITDPPFGERTHKGQYHGRIKERGREVVRRGLPYAAFSPGDVARFVERWGDVPGWLAAFTSDDLVPAYRGKAETLGRTTFAPLACVQIGMNVRLAGDGPSNWTTYLCVSRPKALRAWGSLPGAYVESHPVPGRSVVPGGKPLWLMRAVTRDYSRPGDLICDPCAGGATTLLAAAMEGRRAIGAECDPVTFDKAVARLRRGFTQDMFSGVKAVPKSEQTTLFEGE